MTTAFFFLKKTQSTTATLAILCGALCWGIEKILKRHNEKNYDRSDVFCDMLLFLQWGYSGELPIYQRQSNADVYPVDYEYASVRDLDDLTGTIHVYAAEREDMSQTSQRIRQKVIKFRIR